MPVDLVQDNIGIRFPLQLQDNTKTLPVRLVPDRSHTVELAVPDEAPHLLQQVAFVDHIGDLGNHDVGTVALDFLYAGPSPEGDRPRPGRIRVPDPLDPVDNRPGRKIGSLDVVHEILDVKVRRVDESDKGVRHLSEIVRGNLAGHRDRDAPGAVADKVGELGREYGRLRPGLVVVGHEVHGVLVEILQDLHGWSGHPGLGVSHRRWRVAVYGPEIPLPIDEGVA